jgi:hypothetical protein
MRYVLFAIGFIGLFAGTAQPARAQAIRTGPEANEYLFVFYALDDLARELDLEQIESIKKKPDFQFYAHRFGALYQKRRLLLNQFQRRADVMKHDKNLHAAIEEAQTLMKHVGGYYEKIKAAQDAYDLGFRQIQAKLFSDAELKEKLLQSFIDAESFYISKVGNTAAGGRLDDYTARGLTNSMKRRAVAEYRLSKTKQKLAEDVHRECLKYEAENRPALEAKIDSIHQEFVRDYAKVRKDICAAIVEKYKPLAPKMGLSESDLVMNSADGSKSAKERAKDPFRLIAAARTMKVESTEDAKKAHEFAQECLKAIQWIPPGDSRDTSEVFFYYRGLLCGWAATLSTRAAAIQIGTDSLEKCYRFPAEAAGTAKYAWGLYKSYDKAGAFPRTHVVANNVYAHAYSGLVQDALKIAKDSAGERVDDPNYYYILARLCSIYKFGSKVNIESFYDLGTQYMREAMLLGFTGVEEAKIHPDFENMRKNSKVATKLNQAMFEPDNLFKLTKLNQAARK